jgi:hypothetical protein
MTAALTKIAVGRSANASVLFGYRLNHNSEDEHQVV